MRVISFDVSMGVPFAVAVNLHEPHAALDQSPGHEAFGADVFRDVLVETVEGKRFP